MPDALIESPMSTSPGGIVRNTLTNSLSFAFLFASNLFLLPYVVHSLGDTYYGGIWVIVGTLTAYMGLIDLGTGMAFVKFISEFHAKGEKTHLLEVVNTGAAMYTAIGAILLVVAWFAGEAILRLVGVPPAIMEDALFVLRVGMLILVLANVASPVTLILMGVQRMDISSYVSIATQTVNIAGTIFVLSNGYGVRGLIVNNLVVILLNVLLQSWYAFRLVPILRIGFRYCKIAMARRFLVYGMNLQVSKLAQLVFLQTDRILCLRLFGDSTATYYDIGARLNSASRSLAFLSVSALLPAVAELDALQYRQKIVTLYERGSKYIGVTAIYLFLFVGVFAPDIIHIWLWDDRFTASVDIVRVLALGYFIHVATGAVSPMTAGLGKTEFDRRFGIFTSVVFLVAAISLSVVLGPIGIALGASLSLILGAFYYLYMFHGYLNVSLAEVYRPLGRPLLAGIIAGALAYLVSVIMPDFAGSRLAQGMALLVVFLVYSGAFAGLLVLLRVFDPSDRQMLRSIVGKFTQ